MKRDHSLHTEILPNTSPPLIIFKFFKFLHSLEHTRIPKGFLGVYTQFFLKLLICWSCESSRLEVSFRKVFLKISQIHRKTRVIFSFLIMLRRPPACNFIKKETPTQLFSCEFVKILRTPFLLLDLQCLDLAQLILVVASTKRNAKFGYLTNLSSSSFLFFTFFTSKRRKYIKH